MASNQLFPDWVTGDLITAAKLNQMKNDLIPWAQLGQANGPASLDSVGKLAQPRRVLDVKHVLGTTSGPSTTADIHNYVLPDPQISIPINGGETVIVIAQVLTKIDTAGLRAFARAARSADGGVSWSEFGQYGTINPYSASEEHMLVCIGMDQPPAGTILYGIRFGNEVGNSATVTAALTFRSLMAIVVDY